ncbi:unnamed protein product [Vitrella brassicaformis CCMP3155]|uniref:E3 ubiquitin protein ligase n=3 Tax=Vitrella brassicaformis TaxID=1169539 RepID=A0A0G4E8C3_VITBC|nr:unnamed protein product [Vitrella brassicaformis CCMP3155]|eukprot:CEL91934.1 unnamed protein product [Vitrella brassicaformis CCMP3155]
MAESASASAGEARGQKRTLEQSDLPFSMDVTSGSTGVVGPLNVEQVTLLQQLLLDQKRCIKECRRRNERLRDEARRGKLAMALVKQIFAMLKSDIETCGRGLIRPSLGEWLQTATADYEKLLPRDSQMDTDEGDDQDDTAEEIDQLYQNMPQTVLDTLQKCVESVTGIAREVIRDQNNQWQVLQQRTSNDHDDALKAQKTLNDKLHTKLREQTAAAEMQKERADRTKRRLKDLEEDYEDVRLELDEERQKAIRRVHIPSAEPSPTPKQEDGGVMDTGAASSEELEDVKQRLERRTNELQHAEAAVAQLKERLAKEKEQNRLTSERIKQSKEYQGLVKLTEEQSRALAVSQADQATAREETRTYQINFDRMLDKKMGERLAELRERNSKLTSAVREHEERVREVEDRLRATQEELDKERHRQTLDTVMQELQNVQRCHKEQLERKHRAYEQLRAEYTSQREDYNKAVEARDELAKQCHKKEDELDALRRVQGSVSEAQALASLREEVARLRRNEASMEADTKRAVKDKQEMKQTYEQTECAYEDEIKSKEAKVTESAKTVIAKEKEIERYRHEKVDFAYQRKKYEYNIDDLRKENTEAMVQLEFAQTTLRQWAKLIQELQHKVDICETDRREAIDGRRELQEQNQQNSKKALQEEDRATKLLQEKASVADELKEVRAELDKARKIAKKLQDDLDFAMRRQTSSLSVMSRQQSTTDTSEWLKYNQHLSLDDKVRALADRLSDFERMVRCPVCKKAESRRDAALRVCGHTFCRECIERDVNSRRRKCPVCNEKFNQGDVLELYLS